MLSAAEAPVDDARAASGIRKLSSKHLTLYTDLTGPAIDELPEVFDQAFPQWRRYFGIKEADHDAWRMTGIVMKDKTRFVASGLLPGDLPPFPHGFSKGGTLWVYDQPSDYYRRHLVLHEGVHGLMNTVLGGCGPTWYMEGLAEYLATHQWRDGRLTLAAMPASRDETPEWGRIRIIQVAAAEGRSIPFKEVMELKPSLGRETSLYAWCWAAVTLLDRHPRYQKRFRELIPLVRQKDFNERFYRLFEPDWPELCEEWDVMTANMEYGYDVPRNAVDLKKGSERLSDGQSDPAAVFSTTVAADRGWQNTGLRLEAGKRYRLTASGRYRVAEDPKWQCEPNGVSIRYYQGRPLGILLAAVRPDAPPAAGASALLHPTAVGLGTVLTPAETGTLFLKINHSAGELSRNAGELSVQVRGE